MIRLIRLEAKQSKCGGSAVPTIRPPRKKNKRSENVDAAAAEAAAAASFVAVAARVRSGSRSPSAQLMHSISNDTVKT